MRTKPMTTIKARLLLCTLLTILSAQLGLAQDKPWKDDWKPSAANIAGQEFPQINSERRAQFKIKAPHSPRISPASGWKRGISTASSRIR